jgi:hypothetical protein
VVICEAVFFTIFSGADFVMPNLATKPAAPKYGLITMADPGFLPLFFSCKNRNEAGSGDEKYSRSGE